MTSPQTPPPLPPVAQPEPATRSSASDPKVWVIGFMIAIVPAVVTHFVTKAIDRPAENARMIQQQQVDLAVIRTDIANVNSAILRVEAQITEEFSEIATDLKEFRDATAAEFLRVWARINRIEHATGIKNPEN